MKMIGGVIIVVAVVCAVAALPVGVFVSDSTTVVAQTAEEFEVVHMEIEGMTCGACQAKVKAALIELTEVEEVDVSWESGGADLKVTKGSDKENLTKAVEEAGFTVVAIKTG